MAQRKKAKEKQGMSVYPPYEVAPAVGAFKTTELTLSIRRDAHLTGVAAAEVAPLFSADEWELFAQVFPDRVIEPEAVAPGALLADVLAQVAQRQGAEALGGEVGPAVERLRGLSYSQAWALLVAVRFARDNAGRLGDGARWWEMPVRWKALCGEAQEG